MTEANVEQKLTKEEVLEAIVLAALEEPGSFGAETVIGIMEVSGFGEMLAECEQLITDEAAVDEEKHDDPEPDEEVAP